MAFRFNFTLESEKNIKHEINDNEPDEATSVISSDENSVRDCDFLSLNEDTLKNTNKDISLLKIGDFEIKYVLVNSCEVSIENETFSQIDSLKTDLIPGKYEGGLKIWEGSIDLANYVAEHINFKKEDKVLELGCGAGLPGLISYLKGASVTFQDYNPEVLKFSTVPNTILNTPDDKVSLIPEVCQYLYGDWKSISEKYPFSEKYDYILTAETIYEKTNQKKLLDLMIRLLKPDGTIYLAAKNYYFGVGGGIIDFENLVNSEKSLEIKSVHKITNGLERQILTLRFR